jgi:serine/threonine-protein kinase PpkA
MLQIPGYHVLGLLAKGGTAKIYLGRHLKLKRRVAIKVYQPKESSPFTTELFRQEARILSNLHHIHVVSIYDEGQLPDGRTYLVMEYIEGGNLRDWMKQHTGELQAIGTLVELAYILHFVHNRGIVHCDIKPDNILFRRDRSLVLTDFGIAKRFEDKACTEKSSMTLISPDYASPEQIQGLPFDLRTDIYSAGLVFLEMLTGRNPYRGSTLQETLNHHLTMDVPQLNTHYAHYQPLLDHMLARSPDDRFNSMHECVDCVNQILADLSQEPAYTDFTLDVHGIDEYDTGEGDLVHRQFFRTTVLRSVSLA